MNRRLLLIYLLISLGGAFWACGRSDRTRGDAQTPPRWEVANAKWFVANNKIYEPSGREWRGVGSNLTNLMGRSADFVRNRVENEAKVGFNYIRLWTPNHNSTGPVNMNDRANQVVAIMDRIHANGMKVMLVLWDSYMDLWGTGHAFYRDAQWFKLGYQGDFMAWTRLIVEKVKNHPAMFMYQLVNESSCRVGCAQDFINMYADTAAVIRAIDPNHLISPGGLSFTHALEGGDFNRDHRKFVEALAKADDQVVWTNTIYNYDLPNRLDVESTKDKMPLIVTEYGFCLKGFQGRSAQDGFKDAKYGAAAMFNKWGASGIAAWEAGETNCGYANPKDGNYNITDSFKKLAAQINTKP